MSDERILVRMDDAGHVYVKASDIEEVVDARIAARAGDLELVKRVGDEFEWSEAGVRSIEAVVLDVLDRDIEAEEEWQAGEPDPPEQRVIAYASDFKKQYDAGFRDGRKDADQKAAARDTLLRAEQLHANRTRDIPDPLREAVRELEAALNQLDDDIANKTDRRESRTVPRICHARAKVRALLGDEE